jgi:uncharacterized protein (DUF1697 family)
MRELTVSDKAGIRYAAFLRGINVGGHRLIKMTELARIFTELGLRDVRTVIASGNVVFTSEETDVAELTERIERGLAEALGYPVTVMLRTVEQLRALVGRDPYPAIDPERAHRYVVFFPALPSTVPDLPIHDPDQGFSLLALEGTDLLLIAERLPGRQADYGPTVAKLFGKVSTARNWNTIVKIAGM